MSGDLPPRHGPGPGDRQLAPRGGPAPPAAAYVVHWDGRACWRTPLAGAGDLRAEVDAAAEPPGGAHAHAHAHGQRRRLFVVRGASPEHVAAVGALGVDPALVEAHAARRGYRPPGARSRRRQREREGAVVAHVDYPELVRGYGAAAVVSRVGGDPGAPGGGPPAAGGFVSLLRDPLIRPVSDVEDVAAVFCRASLWAGPRAGVLFLDWPAWEDAASPLQLVGRPGAAAAAEAREAASTSGGSDGAEHESWRGGGFGSLEDELLELLAEVDDSDTWSDTLAGAVADLAYDRWLDFFEVVTPHQQPIIYDGSSLHWQVARSLEQNLDAAGRAAARHGGGSAGPDWLGLLNRARRRVELLPTVTPRPGFVRKLSWFPSAAGSGRDRHRSFRRMESSLSASAGRSGSGAGGGQSASSAAAPGSSSSSSSGSSSDENQRSLDRVTYLGGVLLPFSMVSGILSMNGDFEPGGRLFWVFWAVAVPIAVLTILIIYADSIRKVEVWVEVAAEAAADHEHNGKEAEADPAKDEEKVTPPPAPPKKEAHPHLRHGITCYSTGDEVVIDIPEGADQSPAPLYNRQAVPLVFPAGAATVVLPRALVEEGAELEESAPRVVVERRGDGSRPREWRRQQLGWYGACRHIVGFAPPRAIGPAIQPVMMGPPPAREGGRWRKGGGGGSGSGTSGSGGRRRTVEVV